VAVIRVGLLFLAAFIGLSEAAQRGDEISRAGALIEASMLTLLAAWGVLGALILAAMKCDESCDDESGEWWHTLDAGQWPGQLVVAVLGFAAIVAAFAWTIRRRHRAASASMVAAAACFGAWAAFLAPLGDGLGI
jgi:hypothetical protein